MPSDDVLPTPAVGAQGVDGARWDAIVVAGGRARRLGGINKTALFWHGRSLLDGVLAAVSGAGRVCVVGSDASLPDAVVRAVERPRWGGPAAAIVAGLDALAGSSPLDADWVVVLAGDLVRADDAVELLLAELHRVGTSRPVGTPTTIGSSSTSAVCSSGSIGTSSLSSPGSVGSPGSLGTGSEQAIDGLISVDSSGRRQPLLAVYRRTALLEAAAARPAENLAVSSLIGGLNLAELCLPDALNDDVDTPADAARLGIPLPDPATLPTDPPAGR